MIEQKVKAYYPTDYHRQINRLELEGDGKRRYVSGTIEPCIDVKPTQYYVKFEYPFFTVINPNGHKCYMSDDPNLARREAWRLNNVIL